jgi:hypothetical protein
MEVESLTCSNCGAPLDVPPTAAYVTCRHCGSRLSITRTGSASYTEVLERIGEHTEQMREDLGAIRLQNELEQVDREWQIDREQFRVEGEHGSSLPTGPGMVVAVVVGVVIILFGIFWTIIAGALAPSVPTGAGGSFPGSGPAPANSIGSWFPLFGVLFVIVAIIAVISYVVKAGGYSNAEAQYKERRKNVLRRVNKRR